MIPFFPLARIFASSYIDLSNISWPSLILCSIVDHCVFAYHKLATKFINRRKISMFWTRINHTTCPWWFLDPLYTIRSFHQLGLMPDLIPLSI
jgi:hypothetical protein